MELALSRASACFLEGCSHGSLLACAGTADDGLSGATGLAKCKNCTGTGSAMYSAAGSAVCAASCAPGTAVTDSTSPSACFPCPVGKYSSDSTDAHQCLPCPPGGLPPCAADLPVVRVNFLMLSLCCELSAGRTLLFAAGTARNAAGGQNVASCTLCTTGTRLPLVFEVPVSCVLSNASLSMPVCCVAWFGCGRC